MATTNDVSKSSRTNGPVLPDDSKYTTSLISNPPASETKSTIQTVELLNMKTHPEGGFYAETDRDPLLIPNPFAKLPSLSLSSNTETKDDDNSTRNASTTIFYLLTPGNPLGHFHRNKARTVHTLHRGRGRYVIVHADSVVKGKEARIETFVVGHDLSKGEKMQWIVEGGKFKASFLLPDSGSEEGGTSKEGLLISETVVPGFEFADHDFMTADAMRDLFHEGIGRELLWLLNAKERQKF